LNRTTIASALETKGIGLHTGAPVSLRLEPSESDITFCRPGRAAIEVGLSSVQSDTRGTTLGTTASPDDCVATVEHLLATLSIEGIDAIKIEVDGPELPAYDGSALPFVELLRKAERRSLPLERTPIRLTEAVEVREGDRVARAEPAPEFGFDVRIDFDHASIGEQRLVRRTVRAEDFAMSIAPARTFGFLAEVESLRAAGLAQGASLENTLVLDDSRLMNEGGLRFADEFVRHKALDLLGDLALLGAPLNAFVTVERGGHRLHHRLVEAIEKQIRSAAN